MTDFRERRKGIRVPLKNLGEALQKTALKAHTEQSAEHWLEERGIGEGYRWEVLNTWVRARYSQNLGTITAFGALSAADHAHSVGVVVAALCAAMAEKSGATLRLGVDVLGIESGSWGGGMSTPPLLHCWRCTMQLSLLLHGVLARLPSHSNSSYNLRISPATSVMWINILRCSPVRRRLVMINSEGSVQSLD
jgi:hypothetical protein